MVFLSRGLIAHYTGDDGDLDRYSHVALQRVWGAVRFSWWMTSMLHQFPDRSEFENRLIEQELSHLSSSTMAQAALVEQYVGLPLEELSVASPHRFSTSSTDPRCESMAAAAPA